MSPPNGPPEDPNRRKDAALVDNLLENLFFGDNGGSTASDQRVAGPITSRRPSPGAPSPTPIPRPAPARRPSSHVSRTARPSGNARLGTWARVGLGLVLAGAVTRWPYAHACGLSLAAYLAAVAVVLVAAAWADAHAWQNRMVRAHLASLVLLAWGLALGAGQVLPRVGYASQSASWVCSVPPPATSSTAVPPMPAPEATPGEVGDPDPAPNSR